MCEKNNYRWLVLGVGVLAQAAFAMGFAGIPITGILMREAYHFSLSELGFVLGSMGLGVAVSEILWGLLTDKLGDKAVLIIGLWLSAAVFSLIGIWLTPEASVHKINYLHLGGALALAGAVGGSINSSSGSTIMSWFNDNERGFAMSIRQTAIPIGGAIGTGVLPFLAYSYGFRATFLALVIVNFCIGVVVLLLVTSKQKKVKSQEASLYTIPSPLQNTKVWMIVLSAAFLTVPQMAILTFGGVYMRDVLHVNLTWISIILISIQILGGAIRIWSGYYTDKKKNRMPLLRYYTLLGAISSLLLCVMINDTFISIIFFVLTGLSSHAWHGLAYTEAAVQAGAQRAGTALGMVGTTVFLASFLTPIMVSRVVHNYGWEYIWGNVSMLTLCALFFIILFEKVKCDHLNRKKSIL